MIIARPLSQSLFTVANPESVENENGGTQTEGNCNAPKYLNGRLLVHTRGYDT